MTALDTNIVVRLITSDDPKQWKLAHDIFTTRTCFLPETVILETTSVLRSSYGATREQIHAELVAVLGLPNVRLADADRVQRPLAWYEAGLDVADAFHLTSVQHAEAFLTFDRQLVRRAAGKGTCPVKEPTAE